MTGTDNRTSPVPMEFFVDFALTSGLSRVAAVQRYLAGAESFRDFYQPVREAVVDMHQRGLPATVLDDLLESLVVPREQRIFPKVVAGYKRFLRCREVAWFEPPMRDYPVGAIDVRVRPDLGLLVDGRPHVVALHFRGDPLSKDRELLTTQLMAEAFGAAWPGTTVAVLDVRRGHLHPHRFNEGATHLLRSEAAALAAIRART